jgi:hypothetical protein
MLGLVGLFTAAVHLDLDGDRARLRALGWQTYWRITLLTAVLLLAVYDLARLLRPSAPSRLPVGGRPARTLVLAARGLGALVVPPVTAWLVRPDVEVVGEAVLGMATGVLLATTVILAVHLLRSHGADDAGAGWRSAAPPDQAREPHAEQPEHDQRR